MTLQMCEEAAMAAIALQASRRRPDANIALAEAAKRLLARMITGHST
ncbi:hypothetical protein ACRQ5Q_35055 [Bradyrhizobium sp. PMVTL-01]